MLKTVLIVTKVLLSPGIAGGRFSQVRKRLFLFILRWGMYNQKGDPSGSEVSAITRLVFC